MLGSAPGYGEAELGSIYFSSETRGTFRRGRGANSPGLIHSGKLGSVCDSRQERQPSWRETAGRETSSRHLSHRAQLTQVNCDPAFTPELFLSH